MIRIVDAERKHMVELAKRMRENDRNEIIGMGTDVKTALDITWRESLMTRAAFVDGELAAVWGVGGSALSGCGQPWMLTTPAFETVKFFAVRSAMREIGRWLTVFPRLENHVDATYRGACRFLEVLGFRLEEPRRLPSGMMVRMFWMERGPWVQ